MTLGEFQLILDSNDYPKMMIDEIMNGGLGDHLVREAKSNKQGYVKTRNLLEWIYTIDNAMRMFASLCENFGFVEVLSAHISTYKLRVMRQDKTIGYLFGLLEDKKDEFGIVEYSASQTTLEQIFAMFAMMSIDDGEEHLRFTYDNDDPMKMKKERVSQITAPMQTQIVNVHRHAEEALRIVRLMQERDRRNSVLGDKSRNSSMLGRSSS